MILWYIEEYQEKLRTLIDLSVGQRPLNMGSFILFLSHNTETHFKLTIGDCPI